MKLFKSLLVVVLGFCPFVRADYYGWIAYDAQSETVAEFAVLDGQHVSMIGVHWSGGPFLADRATIYQDGDYASDLVMEDGDVWTVRYTGEMLQFVNVYERTSDQGVLSYSPTDTLFNFRDMTVRLQGTDYGVPDFGLFGADPADSFFLNPDVPSSSSYVMGSLPPPSDWFMDPSDVPPPGVPYGSGGGGGGSGASGSFLDLVADASVNLAEYVWAAAGAALLVFLALMGISVASRAFRKGGVGVASKFKGGPGVPPLRDANSVSRTGLNDRRTIRVKRNWK